MIEKMLRKGLKTEKFWLNRTESVMTQTDSQNDRQTQKKIDRLYFVFISLLLTVTPF
jgi:hypothetical protein